MSNTALQTETKTKAVIYGRISTAAQVNKGHGLASQETRCREFARMKGYEVEKVFTDEAVSGGVIDRPGIQAALSFLRSKRHAGEYVLVIDDISRMARDIRAHLDLRDAIKNVGARLESPSIEFGEDSDSILVENLLASVSQHQRQKGAEQTKNRMRARKLNGYYSFSPPIGYKSETMRGRGKILRRDEPLASIIQEALEGFASGRLQTQAEVARFLKSKPDFPKNRHGEVTIETAHRILTRLLYAGMIERPEWGVSIREAQHDGLISYETYLKIQTRLNEKPTAPARADVSNDFILRGAVACASCGNPLTGYYATSKTGAKHAYYMCYKKGCANHRKSIRRDQLENDFAALLTSLQPTRKLITFARGMFRDIWSQLSAQGETVKAALKRDIANAESQIEKLVKRIVDSDSSAVVSAYEKRIADTEKDIALWREKMATQDQKQKPFEEAFELAMVFIASPISLWNSNDLATRQAVIRLAFDDRPRYCKKEGFRTPAIAYPFRLLREWSHFDSQMAETKGFEPSKQLLTTYSLSRGAPSTTRPRLRRR